MFEIDSQISPQDQLEHKASIEVHCDGSAPPHLNGKIKCGHVAKDSQGNILWRVRLEKPSAPGNSSNVAEYLAIVNALKRLIREGLQKEDIIIISDSQLAIYQILGRYRVKAQNLLPYFNEVKRLASKYKNLKFKWVARENNSEADKLSRE